MTDPEQDEAFEAYLKRRSVLPKTPLTDERLESPAALDDIVLRRAQEAIGAHAAPGHPKLEVPRAPRWATPVALAATIMLCLSVVLNISLNTHRPVPSAERMSAVRTDGTSHTDSDRSEDHRGIVPADLSSREVILTEAKVAGSSAQAPASTVIAEPGSSSEASATTTAGHPSAADRAPAADKAAAFAEHTDRSVQRSTSASNALAQAAVVPHPDDPALWLRQIDALRAAGKSGQAEAEMRLFQARFPGYAAKQAAPASSEPPK